MELRKIASDRKFLDVDTVVTMDIMQAFAVLERKCIDAERGIIHPSVIWSLKAHTKNVREMLDLFDKRLDKERERAAPKYKPRKSLATIIA